MIDALWQSLRQTGLEEVVGVVLGVIYILLIVKRNRLGWIAGGLSSAIFVHLAASAHLPMQSLLQFYYVLMAVYGWISWTRAARASDARISVWPWHWHLASILVIGLVSVLSAHWLALETHAAWPLLDSMTTWTSLLATWLVVRMKLENWLYWICADAVTVFLFAAQGHAFSAALFLTYLVIAVFGFREWNQKLRLQTA